MLFAANVRPQRFLNLPGTIALPSIIRIVSIVLRSHMLEYYRMFSPSQDAINVVK
jgi:hypothetical protein